MDALDFVKIEKLLHDNDFNVRLSVCAKAYGADRNTELKEKLRDSLGEQIVLSKGIIMGNFMFLSSNGNVEVLPFQEPGKNLVNNHFAKIKRSVAVRINIRLKTGGYKSWIVIA